MGSSPQSDATIVALDKMPCALDTCVPSPFVSKFSQSTADKVLSMRSSGQDASTDSKMNAKIVLLGDAAVGKTCLFYRIFRNEFTDLYKTTIGVDFCLLDYLILSVPFRLQLWDTAGSERFKALTYGYYRGAQVVILTFDVTNLNPVQSLRNWHSEVSSMMELHNNQSSPMFFVVGTKVDLIQGVQDSISASANFKLQELEKKVKDFCIEIGAELWLTSSKCNINVDLFFNRIAALLFNDLMSQEITDKERDFEVENGDATENGSRPGSGKIRLKPDANLRGTLTRQQISNRSCCGR
ncbi:ras-related protein Rab-1C-like [Convolutriloba macropyga]|uniref:ras-related protein Rab-1C-like n=1 Tax=Convolutriloba macropyga TaxID=536237 RepID=UPI003F51E69C